MADDTKQPTPADLARELIRLDDANAEAKLAVAHHPLHEDQYARATCGLIFHREAHARTIAEALLAAEGYIATLELANGGNNDHIAAIEGQLLAAEAEAKRQSDKADEWCARAEAAERRVAELERTASEGWGVAGAVVFEDERDMEKMRADIDEACQYADRLRKRVEELEGACEKAMAVLPGLEVLNWPSGHAMKLEAVNALRAVLAKGAK